MKSYVWDIVPIPKRKLVVTSIWIYKIKHVAYGSVDKYKAMFYSCGFSQKEGIEYEDNFDSIARLTTIRYIISLAFVLGWKLH